MRKKAADFGNLVRSWLSWVEQQAPNLRVGGSSDRARAERFLLMALLSPKRLFQL